MSKIIDSLPLSPAAALNTPPLQRASKLGELLSQHFNTPFDLITATQRFRLAAPTATDPTAAEASPWRAESLSLSDVLAARQTRVHPIDLETALLVVPVGDRRTERALVGNIPTTDMRLAPSLAACLVENFDRQQELAFCTTQLNEYASQVTRDFEELSWLRSLAEQPELWHPHNDLASVAKVILPPLCDVLHVEVISLFLTEPQSGDAALAFRTGLTAISDEVMTKLVAQFADHATEHPIVRSCHNKLHPGERQAGIESYVLIPIVNNGQRFGWLMMVNKIAKEPSPGAPTQPRDGDRESDPECSTAALWAAEFGTFEAGLLQSAGVNLAAHASNLQSFREIEDLVVGVIRAMINSIDAKDPYTRGHSDRVAAMARVLTRQLGLSQLDQHHIYMAGLLHDIGKIGLPDAVLSKPGRLTEQEFAEVQRHPEIGVSILQHLKQLQFALPGVLHHHESFDGSGYPHGLAGDEIPLMGRILAVADAYDAMTSNRPYRDGMPSEKAISILQKGSGQQWDGRIIDAFMQCVDEIQSLCQYHRSHPEATLDAVRIAGFTRAEPIGFAANSAFQC